MNTGQMIELERLRYWQGQELRHRDFNDQLAAAAQLRWWHNRALHNTFGISYGLETTPIPARPPQMGIAEIRVEPGLAYDCFGRELLLQKQEEVPIPKVSIPTVEEMTLLIRYRETSQLFICRGTDALCSGANDVISYEHPDFIWLPSPAVQVSDGVPIAQIWLGNSIELGVWPIGLRIPPSLAQRIHYDAQKQILMFKGTMSDDEKKVLFDLTTDLSFRNAISVLYENIKKQKVFIFYPAFAVSVFRPLARPRIGNGSTVPSYTAWREWTWPPNSSQSKTIGFEVEVDTSAAGFTEVPCYFAWLQGQGLIETAQNGKITRIWAPFGHIGDSSVKHFIFRLWLPEFAISGTDLMANKDFESAFLSFAQKQGLYVSWLGIQPTAKPRRIFLQRGE